MARLDSFFPKSHGKPHVDDRRVQSGIILINCNSLRWYDAPREYGSPKTLYNRWKRWGDNGIFARMMKGLASEAAVPKAAMINVTNLKAHRTATSVRSKKGGARRSERPPDRPDQGRHEHQSARRHRRGRSPDPLLNDRRPSQRLYGCRGPFG